jgi:hypothetical protein
MKSKVLLTLIAIMLVSVGFTQKSTQAVGNCCLSEFFLGGKWNYYAVYWNYDSTVPSSYHTPLKDAAKTWNGKANKAYRFFPDWQGYTVKPHVWVIKTPDENYWTSKGTYGIGIPGPDFTSGIYTEGRLEIVTNMSNGLTPAKKTSMLIHEFGHLLGLAHVKNYAAVYNESVMDEIDVWDLSGPTTFDIQNLNYLYPN